MMRQITFRAMGCQVSAALESLTEDGGEELDRLPEWFEHWERRLSRFREESELSAFNAGMASNASAVSIAQAKAWATGASVYVTGGRVSAAFNGEFYIQTANRTQGIGIIWSGAVTEGQDINVFGKLTADPNGGRKIAAYSVYPQ